MILKLKILSELKLKSWMLLKSFYILICIYVVYCSTISFWSSNIIFMEKGYKSRWCFFNFNICVLEYNFFSKYCFYVLRNLIYQKLSLDVKRLSALRIEFLFSWLENLAALNLCPKPWLWMQWKVEVHTAMFLSTWKGYVETKCFTLAQDHT